MPSIYIASLVPLLDTPTAAIPPQLPSTRAMLETADRVQAILETLSDRVLADLYGAVTMPSVHSPFFLATRIAILDAHVASLYEIDDLTRRVI